MSCELSFVIPVFNSAQSISSVVEEIHAACDDIDYEVVLVNDGSADDSEAVWHVNWGRGADVPPLLGLDPLDPGHGI